MLGLLAIIGLFYRACKNYKFFHEICHPTAILVHQTGKTLVMNSNIIVDIPSQHDRHFISA